MTLTKLLPTCSLLALGLMMSACQSGLSGPGKTHTLGYDLNLLKPKDVAEPPAFPAHLVVAQAGANSPDPALINALKAQDHIFSNVSVLPAAPQSRDLGSDVPLGDPSSLLDLAKQLGGDLVLLVGGSIETASNRTSASVLDLSVVGHYVLPTNEVKARGKAMGALLDVNNHRLLMTTFVNDARHTLSPSVSRFSHENKQFYTLQRSLLQSLAKEFIGEISRRGGIAPKDITNFRTSSNDEPKTTDAPYATVFLISNGFHFDLIVPVMKHDGKSKAPAEYVLIGLGERRWINDQSFRWLDRIMAFVAHNEGSVVMDNMGKRKTAYAIKKAHKAWQVTLSESEWGHFIQNLERDLYLQPVNKAKFRYGNVLKVVDSKGGYSLFRNCHHFALAPFGRTAKTMVNFPTPAALIEDKLDKHLERVSPTPTAPQNPTATAKTAKTSGN